MTDYLTYHNDMCRGVYIAKDFLFLKDMIVSSVNRFKSKNQQEYYQKKSL